MNQRLSNLETSKTSTIFHISKFLMQIGQDLILPLISMKLLTFLFNIVNNEADKNAPFCEHKIKGKNSSWINEEFLNAMPVMEKDKPANS